MSDYVNNNLQNALLEDELANVDWAQLQEEVMSEPWLKFDDFNWSAWDQGVEDQAPVPGHGQKSTAPDLGMRFCTSKTVVKSPAILPPLPTSTTPGPSTLNVEHAELLEVDKPFVCGFQGCSKAFKRCGDLNRHQKVHASQKPFKCPAQGCKRGINGFPRQDKLNDHIRDSHDDNDIFVCTRPGCGRHLRRDLFYLHAWKYYHLNDGRDCPLPRCPFKTSKRAGLDSLQSHFKNAHDLHGRANYANVLRERGYDFQSCKIVCPVCPNGPQFITHEEFKRHFVENHFNGPACGCGWRSCLDQTCWGRDMNFRLRQSHVIPDEVRQHRRTILSLMPEYRFSPVFDDLKPVH